MIKKFKKILNNQAGVTIAEVLVAGFLTGIIALSAYQFYVKAHNVTGTQQEISDSQIMVRNSLQELKKTLRMAGYRVNAHAAYEVNGDTLSVYMSQTNPVDTILYFLQEYSFAQYSHVPNLPTGRKLYNLMKQTNSGIADIFSDNIISINYNFIDSANVEILVTAQTSRPDEDLNLGNGYRTFTLTERIKIRNIS